MNVICTHAILREYLQTLNRTWPPQNRPTVNMFRCQVRIAWIKLVKIWYLACLATEEVSLIKMVAIRSTILCMCIFRSWDRSIILTHSIVCTCPKHRTRASYKGEASQWTLRPPRFTNEIMYDARSLTYFIGPSKKNRAVMPPDIDSQLIWRITPDRQVIFAVIDSCRGYYAHVLTWTQCIGGLQLDLMENNKSLCIIDAKTRNMRRYIYHIVNVCYKSLFIGSGATTSLLNVRETSLEVKIRPTTSIFSLFMYSALDGCCESGVGHKRESSPPRRPSTR